MKTSAAATFLFIFLLATSAGRAQEGVRGNNTKKDLTGKIMTIPFEQKLYMSDIDQKINQQTGWSSSTIKEYFRHQLDNQLKLKLQSVLSPVVTFYTDSAKTARDLDFIYKSTAIYFDVVGKPTAPTSSPRPREQGIKNGQLAVEINDDKKFSNIRITGNDLVPYLNNKYKCEYFVFVNELDITMVADSYDMATDSYMREVTVHYTIIDKNSKLLVAGAAVSKINSRENNPKKIVSMAFSPIASYIATRLSLAIKPIAEK